MQPSTCTSVALSRLSYSGTVSATQDRILSEFFVDPCSSMLVVGPMGSGKSVAACALSSLQFSCPEM